MINTKSKTIRERGLFKTEIHNALYKSEDIRDLLLGDTSDMTTREIMTAFKDHVKSHLFVDDTVTETDTFIFYDVVFPSLTEHIKDCKVIMYLVCHRDILENYHKDGYVGDRIDILGQMVEDTLLNDPEVVNNFGVGELQLTNVSIYNATRFYGVVLNFTVPNIRWR